MNLLSSGFILFRSPKSKTVPFSFCQCLHFFFIGMLNIPVMLKNSLEGPNAPTSHACKKNRLMPF